MIDDQKIYKEALKMLEPSDGGPCILPSNFAIPNRTVECWQLYEYRDVGLFKAPKAGTYFFAFPGVKTNQATHSAIKFRLNGNRIGSAFLGFTISTWTAGSLHANFKVKVGD